VHNLLDCPNGAIRVGMAVPLTFVDIEESPTFAQFRPVVG
jgi:hypothetical protein